MITMQPILLICWVVFLIYWMMSAKNLKPVQEVKVSFSNYWWNLSGKVALAALFILGIDRFFPAFPLSFIFIPRLQLLDLAGVALVGIGLIIALVARKTLADNWSANIDVKKNHELITHGIYAYVRHPIYTGVLAMGLGTLLATGTVSMLIFFLIMFFFLLYKLREEEKLMIKYFPKEYISYMKRVKALIPFVL